MRGAASRVITEAIMMDRQLGLPITFALALAAASPSAKPLLSGDAGELLQRGTLKELLSSAQDESAAGQAKSGAPDRMAQSCGNKIWRRC
jgi:hypothetical protein